MYLVLTAMLALNVSAEVINAFFKLDKGLQGTTKIVKEANGKVIESMVAATEKRPEDKFLVDEARKAQEIVSEFADYVSGLRTKVYELAGGTFYAEGETPKVAPGAVTTDVTKFGKPVKYKDKEIPQRLFVDGNDGSIGDEPAYPAEGPIFMKKIEETKQKLKDLLLGIKSKRPTISEAEINQVVDQLSLNIDKEGPKKADKSWEDYNFGHMPVAAVIPMISKFETDAKNSEAAILNFLAKQVGSTVLEFDKFQPVASAEKGYVISGDKYEAEIFLSAASKQAKYTVSVNGRSLSVKDGVAKYSTTTSSTGEQKYNVSISLKNPFTGKTDNFKKTFKYEVGRRSVTVSADKMNVFYVGVTNPISVAAAGVSSNKLKVSCSGGGCSMTKKSNGKYDIKVSQPGSKAVITVSGGGLDATRFEYRVKRIPDPVAIVGGDATNQRGGGMRAGTFKGQKGVAAILKNFDFEARCNLQSFELTRQAKRSDPVTERQNGGSYRGKVQTLVSMAKAGDTYYFDNIKARCPGDNAGRNIGSLVFKIK